MASYLHLLKHLAYMYIISLNLICLLLHSLKCSQLIILLYCFDFVEAYSPTGQTKKNMG
jgi:hypothetical protein